MTRITALAGPGEVMISGVTRDLVAETSLAFSSRGEHELKGVPRPVEVWQLESE